MRFGTELSQFPTYSYIPKGGAMATCRDAGLRTLAFEKKFYKENRNTIFRHFVQ